MVKVEEIKSVKIMAKGILKAVELDSFILEDEREHGEDKLFFSDIKNLIGKSITITIANKEIVEE